MTFLKILVLLFIHLKVRAMHRLETSFTHLNATKRLTKYRYFRAMIYTF